MTEHKGWFPKVFGFLFMTCKEAVGEMNSENQRHRHSINGMRLKVHLFFCKVCAYYFQTGQILKKAIQTVTHESESKIDIEKLNNELMTRFVPVKVRRKTNPKSD